jgi:hypothetical protein
MIFSIAVCFKNKNYRTCVDPIGGQVCDQRHNCGKKRQNVMVVTDARTVNDRIATAISAARAEADRRLPAGDINPIAPLPHRKMTDCRGVVS